DRFNMIIDGGGPSGKIYVAGGGDAIKGFIENPTVDLPLKDGKLDVGGAVGANGELTLVKDLGLKEPYVGKTSLVNGEIAEDFAGYLLNSEGINNAVSLGVLTDKNGCRASGGVFVEALPSVNEYEVVILEDVISALGSFSSLLAEKPVEEIADFYFAHLNSEIFPAQEFFLRCDCSQIVEGVVQGLGEKEAEDILKEQGKVELHCDYCSKYYTYSKEDLERIFHK
ncbi:MAG: Hsp33 family molecular chaperone HslO, partial [Clostridia bacterium]